MWTDFTIQSDGFSRFIIRDAGMRSQQSGRLVQRVLEIETYRMFALLGLPYAMQAAPSLNAIENELAILVAAMVETDADKARGDDGASEQALLDRITRLAARIEKLSLDNSYRFSASKAYMGLIPNASLQAGKTAKFNPGARGRMYVVTTNVIRAQDEYYAGLYYQKKGYYEGIMGDYLEHPEKCPRYVDCMKKLQGAAVKRAARDKTKPVNVKKPSCKGHIDNMAKRWLSGLLVSHATEIICREEGLDTSAFKAHRGYIPVSPY